MIQGLVVKGYKLGDDQPIWAEFIRTVELQKAAKLQFLMLCAIIIMCNYYIPRNEYYRLTYLWIPLLALVPK